MDRIFNKFKETPPHSICLLYRMTKIESARIEYQVDVDKSVPWHRSWVVSENKKQMLREKKNTHAPALEQAHNQKRANEQYLWVPFVISRPMYATVCIISI